MKLLAVSVFHVLAAAASNIRVETQYPKERLVHVTYADQVELMLVFQRPSQVAALDRLAGGEYASLFGRLQTLPEFEPNYISESCLNAATSSPVIGSAGYLYGEIDCHYRTHGWFARIVTKQLPDNHWIKSKAGVVSEARKLCSLIHH